MKREISNEQILLIPVLFFLFGLTIASVAAFIFFNEYSQFGIAASIVLLLVLGLLAWYYSTRFYKVSFDSDFLYLSRVGLTQKIGLEKVVDITPSVFPFRIFYLNAYIITITYLEFDVKKKIKFLSRGAFRNVGTIKGIPHLDKLRQCVLDKKYGR